MRPGNAEVFLRLRQRGPGVNSGKDRIVLGQGSLDGEGPHSLPAVRSRSRSKSGLGRRVRCRRVGCTVGGGRACTVRGGRACSVGGAGAVGGGGGGV